jgi:hypothetical protein
MAKQQSRRGRPELSRFVQSDSLGPRNRDDCSRWKGALSLVGGSPRVPGDRSRMPSCFCAISTALCCSDARVLAVLSERELVPEIWLPDPRVRSERE